MLGECAGIHIRLVCATKNSRVGSVIFACEIELGGVGRCGNTGSHRAIREMCICVVEE